MLNDFKLDNITTLIITGAGFSCDAGLPQENEVMPRAIELCKRSKPELIDGIMRDVAKIFNPNTIFDLSVEEILTKLTVEELFSHPPRDYVQEILPLELGVLELFCKTLKINTIPNYYFSLVDLYKEHTAFVTFNNDLLLEKIFQQRKYYWNYIETGKVENELGYKDYYYKLLEASYFNLKPDVIPYLKLHGSFNWHYCWRCWNVRITSEKYFGISGEPFSMTDRFSQSCLECSESDGWQPIMRPLVIPPSLIKYYGIRFIQHLWFVFYELIRSVSKIIIIGSSLRDEDTLYLNALSFLNQKNTVLRELIFINPNEKLIEKLRTLTGFEVVHYPSIQDYLSFI